ncbi:MAG TPA: SIMPL domain-containing protein [Bacteroidales bacterium]|nr:SIMPL domain-containing protein [Bacteroidales bacterium]
MENKKELTTIIVGLLIAISLLFLGYFIYKGLKSFSDKDRVVTVKGLAEKEIKATEAYINIKATSSGDNPQEIISTTNKNIDFILSYLKEKGYKEANIKTEEVSVYDGKEYYQYDYNLKEKIKIDRYKATRIIRITVSDVEKAGTMSNNIDLDLIGKNLSSDISCDYKFPELNSIKPALIAESTKNARLSGEQFANDSKSKLGKIKTASQGQISIVGTYYYDEEQASSAPKEPYLQKARVVSTIVFFLED